MYAMPVSSPKKYVCAVAISSAEKNTFETSAGKSSPPAADTGDSDEAAPAASLPPSDCSTFAGFFLCLSFAFSAPPLTTSGSSAALLATGSVFLATAAAGSGVALLLSEDGCVVRREEAQRKKTRQMEVTAMDSLSYPPATERIMCAGIMAMINAAKTPAVAEPAHSAVSAPRAAVAVTPNHAGTKTQTSLSDMLRPSSLELSTRWIATAVSCMPG
mmetsp:Transcript_547/g.1617  ORF Transcript_547/g.1617 Transcript_547/m.1617 type:complete len:216 (-) Transcript_547:541-1188(-)